MDDLDKYIETRKKQSSKFAKNFDKGYEQFKIKGSEPGSGADVKGRPYSSIVSNKFPSFSKYCHTGNFSLDIKKIEVQFYQTLSLSF